MPLLAALIPIFGNLLDRLIPDPEARARAMQDLLAQLHSADLAQVDVNKAEAATGRLFIAGWRPAIGWCCALAVCYTYVIRPFGLSILSVVKPEWATMLLNLPSIDNNLWELTFALLGMGALRSFEKVKGAAK